MPCNITNQQVTIYMTAKRQGDTQVIAAAKAGFSERTARRVDTGKHREKKERSWRTRRDPFEHVWESELVPLLQQTPTLTPLTLLELLQAKYVAYYPDTLLRTLQRRVKQWKRHHGQDKEVMFYQTHLPGRQGFSDFTRLKNIVITIQGQPLEHLLYHFRLAYSGWSYMKVILGGESYTALTEGLQEALWRLGGAPYEHRTDSLSAAFRNLHQESSDDVTQRYEAFCQHFNMQPTRNNPGIAHENGSIESAHGHVKRRIQQALLVRQSTDFGSVQAYQQWLDSVVHLHNQRNAKTWKEECKALQPLPAYRTQDFTEVFVRVTSASTIDVRRVTYTVPARLMGERLRIHLYDDRLCCYLGTQLMLTLTRVYPRDRLHRARAIDYRHVIKSLVRKPQAFRYSRLRDDLLPNKDWHLIWQHIDQYFPAKAACKLIVSLLALACDHDCETALSRDVLTMIEANQPISLALLQQRYQRVTAQSPPLVDVQPLALKHYDHLFMLQQSEEVQYA